MFPFLTSALRDRVWADLADKQHDNGWSVYTVDRSGALHRTTGLPNKFPIPGKLVEYWVPPNETDWRTIFNGLLDACVASGRISLH